MYIWTIKFGLDKQEVSAVYQGYIRPLLEYADVVWHPGLTQNLSKAWFPPATHQANLRKRKTRLFDYIVFPPLREKLSCVGVAYAF